MSFPSTSPISSHSAADPGAMEALLHPPTASSETQRSSPPALPSEQGKPARTPVARAVDPTAVKQLVMDPLGLQPEAFEELTFQASQRVEDETHDDNIDREVERAQELKDAQVIVRVSEVLRMMTDPEGYRHLAQRATEFARMWANDQQGALDLLEPENFPPSQLKALTLTAAHVLSSLDATMDDSVKVDAMALLDRLKAVSQSDDATLQALLKRGDSSLSIRPDSPQSAKGALTKSASALLLLMQSQPSARAVLDAVPSGQLDVLSAQLQDVQRQGRFIHEPTRGVGMMVALSKWIAVVMTMNEFGQTLKMRIGGKGEVPVDPTVTRLLLDMCSAFSPAPNLERLRSTLTKGASPRARYAFDVEMFRQICNYPPVVWARPEGKEDLRIALRKAMTGSFTPSDVLAAQASQRLVAPV
ncbi:MAG: hypothetical protein ABW220_08260 [Burkholderiaceae bacterium]